MAYGEPAFDKRQQVIFMKKYIQLLVKDIVNLAWIDRLALAIFLTGLLSCKFLPPDTYLISIWAASAALTARSILRVRFEKTDDPSQRSQEKSPQASVELTNSSFSSALEASHNRYHIVLDVIAIAVVASGFLIAFFDLEAANRNAEDKTAEGLLVGFGGIAIGALLEFIRTRVEQKDLLFEIRRKLNNAVDEPVKTLTNDVTKLRGCLESSRSLR